MHSKSLPTSSQGTLSQFDPHPIPKGASSILDLNSLFTPQPSSLELAVRDVRRELRPEPSVADGATDLTGLHTDVQGQRRHHLPHLTEERETRQTGFERMAWIPQAAVWP